MIIYLYLSDFKFIKTSEEFLFGWSTLINYMEP